MYRLAEQEGDDCFDDGRNERAFGSCAGPLWLPMFLQLFTETGHQILIDEGGANMEVVDHLGNSALHVRV